MFVEERSLPARESVTLRAQPLNKIRVAAKYETFQRGVWQVMPRGASTEPCSQAHSSGSTARSRGSVASAGPQHVARDQREEFRDGHARFACL